MKKQLDKELNKFGNVQSLMRYFDEKNLFKLHLKLDGNKATGVDKITKEEYGANVFENINNLVERMKTGKYKPLPVRRVLIPKPNGKERSLGIPSYEDKIVQSRIAQILNIIFERYFKDFSYGFRPNRDCHQAIKRIDEIIM